MMNDKDHNSDENLKKLMESAADNSGLDDLIDSNKDSKEKSTKKIVMFTIAGLFAFGVVLVSAALMLNNNPEFVDKSETPSWVEKEGINEEDGENDYDYWEFEHPVELKDWATRPFERDEFWSIEGIEDEVLEISREMQSFYSTVSWMKSGLPHPYEDEELAGPFTNDISKRYLKDGSENPDFSYALSEDYQKAYVTYTERLLNPIFGGWVQAQSSERNIKNDSIYNQLKDMFSSEWWNNNIKEGEDYSNLPIVAEWNNGDWDKYNLAERNSNKYGAFYGEVKETEDRYLTTKAIGLDEENQAIIEVSSPVEYSAFGADGELVKITGTLELTLRSDIEKLNVENRVIIDEARLVLDK